MSVSYVTTTQVQNCLQSLYGPNDATNILPGIITSCSAWLDNYCNRANGGFSVQSYDELYSGTGCQLLFLNNTPIQSIQRLTTIQLPALSIINNDGAVDTRATVTINGTASNPINLNSQNQSTGITLTYIKNAVTTTNTLTWTSYPTVTSLVAAINAVGNNWSANVQGGFGGWSTTDLRATQGAFGARITTCYLWIHWLDLPGYRVNENTGEIFLPSGFDRGQFNYRIGYTAGYSTFPDDLTQALSEICANAYLARSQNSNLQSASLGGESYTQYAQKGFEGLSIMSRNTVNRYKIRKVSKFSTW